MTDFRILKNVPLPDAAPRRSKYPFSFMDVGDAFDAPLASRKNISAAACNWGRKRDPAVRFVTRKISSDTIRIWRAA